MAKYIDADKMLEEYKHSIYDTTDLAEMLNYMPAADVVSRGVLEQVICERDIAISQLAEIGKELGEKMDDVQEVRHGRWIMHIDDLFPAESTMECDQCHEEQPLECDDKYCPNCGARMVEGEKELLKQHVDDEDLLPELPQENKNKNTEITKAYKEGYEQGKKDAERHGRWVSQEYMSEIDSFIYTEYKCSNCGEVSKKKSNYCPNCGARINSSAMKGE